MNKNWIFSFLVVISIMLITSLGVKSNTESISTYPLSAINPTAESNPSGANFPGVRGGNQLIMYTNNFDNYTGTNEYGAEIIVVDNRVIAKSGSNTKIPKNGFVLSGHGKAKSWLNEATIVGAYIEIDNDKKIVTSSIRPSSYIFRAKQMYRKAKDSVALLEADKTSPKNRVMSEKALTKAKESISKARYSMMAMQNIDPDKIINNANQVYENAQKAYFYSLPAIKGKEIGVWCRPVVTDEKTIIEKIERMKAAGIKNIYLETFFHGYTIYPSDLAKQFGFAVQNPKFEGVDVLELWVKNANERGLKVYPWIETFYVGAGNPGSILTKNKEWANIQRLNASSDVLKPSTLEPGAFFMDPANPEVRSFLVELVSEMIEKYDVAGINLDYIRYPNSLPEHFPSYLDTTWGYTNVAIEEFNEQAGVSPLTLTPSDPLWVEWQEYRQGNINLTVMGIYEAVKDLKPEMSVSAVVFPDLEKAKVQKLQDWKAWIDSEYIDVLTPIVLGSSPELEKYNSNLMVKMCKNKCNVIMGVFGAFNNDSPLLLVDQVMAVGQTSVKGINFFDYAHLNDQYIEALLEGPLK